MPPELPSKDGFGATLRQMRIERGISCNEMSIRTGLTRIAIADLERGRGQDVTIVPLYLSALRLESRTMMLLLACADRAYTRSGAQ